MPIVVFFVISTAFCRVLRRIFLSIGSEIYLVRCFVLVERRYSWKLLLEIFFLSVSYPDGLSVFLIGLFKVVFMGIELKRLLWVFKVMI